MKYETSYSYEGFRLKTQEALGLPCDGSGCEYSFKPSYDEPVRGRWRGRIRTRRRKTVRKTEGIQFGRQIQRQASRVFGEAKSQVQDASLRDDSKRGGEEGSSGGGRGILDRLDEGRRIQELLARKRFNIETFPTERLILSLTEDEHDYLKLALKAVKSFYDIPTYRWREASLACLAKDYLQLREGYKKI